MDVAQSVGQAGFRAGFSCSDHLFCLAQLQEKNLEWQQDIWIVAIDFVKAFDTINHAKLFAALRARKSTSAYVELLEAAYGSMKATVRVDCASRESDIKKGGSARETH